MNGRRLALLLMLASILPAAAAAPDWREFDRRQTQFGESPREYDAARIERREPLVRLWIRYRILYSGRNDTIVELRLELDCARRTRRTLERIERDEIIRPAGVSHRRIREAHSPIEPGSPEETLLPHFCPVR